MSGEGAGAGRVTAIGLARTAAITAAITAAFLIAGAPLAAAQPADKPAEPDRIAQADALFLQGKELMTAGKLAEACAAFERSQGIDPKITTLVNHANCREKNNQLATASRLFAEAAAQLSGLSDVSGVALRTLATDRVTALEPRLSRLTLNVAANPPDGLKVLRDDLAVDAAEWSQPLPIDGGTHTFAARAPGYQPWTTTVTVRAEGDALLVDVPALERDTVPTPGGSEDGDGKGDSGPTDAAPRRRSWLLPASVGAGALVLGGVALGYELWAESLQSEAVDYSKQGTMGPDGPERTQLDALVTSRNKSANRHRHYAQGLGAAAGVAAGVAIYLYVRGRGDEPATATARATRRVVPLIGGGVAGLQLQGQW